MATSVNGNLNSEPFIVRSNLEGLLHSLNALRTAGKLCDVTIIVEGCTFKAHRAILAASSDYFCAMFTGGMRESEQEEIHLNEISAHSFELLLHYVYTSCLELSSANVQDVLSAAAFMQMRDITEDCVRYLEEQIDLENCVEIAVLANLYSLERLQEKASRFLCARFDEFMKTQDWLRLPWRQLEHLLSNDYIMDCSEERLLEIVLEYCQKTNLKAELAQSIFKHLRFDEIRQSALDKATSMLECLIQRHEEREKDQEKQQHKITNYIKIMETEAQRRLSLSSSKLPISETIFNSRGMDLVLVTCCIQKGKFIICCYLPTMRKWEVLAERIYRVDGSVPYVAVLGSYLFENDSEGVFCYSSVSNTWRRVADIQRGCFTGSLQALGSDTLWAIINGNYERESNCIRYSARENRWDLNWPSLPEYSHRHAGVSIGDKLYISGGLSDKNGINRFNRDILNTLWCLDTKARNWTKLRSMLTPRFGHVLLAIDGKIYACAGYDTAISLAGYDTAISLSAKTIEVYDVSKDVWSVETEVERPQLTRSVTDFKRKIYYFLNNFVDERWYDLDTKTWTTSSCEFPYSYCSHMILNTLYMPRVRDSTFHK